MYIFIYIYMSCRGVYIIYIHIYTCLVRVAPPLHGSERAVAAVRVLPVRLQRMQRLPRPGGRVFKAHRLVYHSTLGSV